MYLLIWKICKEVSEIKIRSRNKNSPKLYEFESSEILGNHYNWVFLPRSRKYVNTFIKSNPIFTTGGLLSWVTIHEKKGVLYKMKKKLFFLCIIRCPSHLISKGRDHFCLFQDSLISLGGGWTLGRPVPIWACSVLFWAAIPLCLPGYPQWETWGIIGEPECSPSLNRNLGPPTRLLEWGCGSDTLSSHF